MTRENAEATHVAGGSWASLLRNNPGVALTLAYLFVSLLGLTFSWALYRRFDINVFQFADVSDFLMGAFREPMTFALAGSALIVGWSAVLLNRWEERVFAEPESMNRLARGYAWLRSHLAPGTWPLILTFAYCLLFIDTYASREARRIQAGDGGTVSIETQDGRRLERTLMGATSGFLFFYDARAARIEILPHEGVARIMHATPRPPKDPAAP